MSSFVQFRGPIEPLFGNKLFQNEAFWKGKIKKRNFYYRAIGIFKNDKLAQTGKNWVETAYWRNCKQSKLLPVSAIYYSNHFWKDLHYSKIRNSPISMDNLVKYTYFKKA